MHGIRMNAPQRDQALSDEEEEEGRAQDAENPSTAGGSGTTKKRKKKAKKRGRELHEEGPTAAHNSAEARQIADEGGLPNAPATPAAVDWAARAAQSKLEQRKGLKMGPPSRRVDLRFENIYYTITMPKPVRPWEWQSPSTWLPHLRGRVLSSIPFTPKPTIRREILHGVSGHVAPGRMLAIMGPTGSGKTTLLNVLAGRAKRGVVGKVYLNDERMRDTKHNNAAYVLQDDIFFHNLTVRETIRYNAYMKLPREMSLKEKRKRVESVLEELSISHCANTIIGSQFARGISGGERKRTNIGTELVTDPSLMFLDEPTSGLDSTTAYNLVLTLKALAESGRTIVTTIHQPSSQMFELFDDIMLLVDGYVMYYGKAADVLSYFGDLGFHCMPHYNPADFMLDLAVTGSKQKMEDSDKTITEHLVEIYSKDHPVLPREEAKKKKGIKKAAEGTKHKITGTVAEKKAQFEESKERRKWKKERKQQKNNRKKAKKRSTGDIGDEEADDEPQESYPFWPHRKWATGFGLQMWVLFERGFKQRKGDTLTLLHFVQVLALAVISGLLWLRVGDDHDAEGLQNRIGFIFFLSMFWALHSWFGALTSFPIERGVVMKERAAGTYRLSAYFFAKTVADTMVDFVFPILFLCITYWMVGLNPNVGRFFLALVIVLILTFLGGSLGLLISAVIFLPRTALVLSSILVLTATLLGGFFITSFPSWLEWAKWVSFIKYAFEGLLINDMDSLDETFEDANGNEQSSSQIVDDLVETELWWDILVLLGYALVARFFAYLALRILNKPRG